MAWRAYLVPKVGTGADRDSFRPAYVSALPVNYACMDYGNEPWFLVLADVDATQHTTISGSANVAAFPQDLSTLVGANLATVQNELEIRNMPGTWVTAAMTFRQVLAGVAAVCRLSQRWQGRNWGQIFSGGITLDTQWSDLSSTVQTRLLSIAQSFSLDTSGLTGTTTVRQILRFLAQQLPSAKLALETL